jgi:RNA polymerase sigma-70 factor (ECF subfamily)
VARLVEELDALMVLVSSGDRRAFEAVYDASSGKTYGVVLRCVVNAAQSEEVLQDVYLEVWQRAANYDPARGSALAWLLTVAHRRAIDRVRASQASHDRDLRIGIRDLPHEFDHVAEAVEVASEFARARTALSVLTALQREAVTLAYFEGLSVGEIAVALDVPPGTIKTRLRDGLKRMRSEMAQAS